MPLLVSKQRTDEWHEAHKGRISASLASACLGLDSSISRKLAWRLILGHERQEENEFMKWGNQREELAKWVYEVQIGNLITETGFWIHPIHDWLGASPDALIGEDGLLEVKCPQTLPTSVPIKHRIQMLVQMEVCQRKFADYFAWHPTGIFHRRVYPAGTETLIERLEDFYCHYVAANFEPPRRKKRNTKK